MCSPCPGFFYPAQSHTISIPGTTINAPHTVIHPTLASALAALGVVLAWTTLAVAALAVGLVVVCPLAVLVTTLTLPLPWVLNAPGLKVKPVFEGKAVVAAAEGEAVR